MTQHFAFQYAFSRRAATRTGCAATRLEVEFEHVGKDLDEIEADLKTVVSQMATKSGLWGMVANVLARCFPVESKSIVSALVTESGEQSVKSCARAQ